MNLKIDPKQHSPSYASYLTSTMSQLIFICKTTFKTRSVTGWIFEIIHILVKIQLQTVSSELIGSIAATVQEYSHSRFTVTRHHLSVSQSREPKNNKVFMTAVIH